MWDNCDSCLLAWLGFVASCAKTPRGKGKGKVSMSRRANGKGKENEWKSRACAYFAMVVLHNANTSWVFGWMNVRWVESPRLKIRSACMHGWTRTPTQTSFKLWIASSLRNSRKSENSNYYIRWQLIFVFLHCSHWIGAHAWPGLLRVGVNGAETFNDGVPGMANALLNMEIMQLSSWQNAKIRARRKFRARCAKRTC